MRTVAERQSSRWRWWRLDALDRRILAIAVPALGSLLIQPIYSLTDTAVVGRIGTEALGGLALATTVLNTLVWVFNFLSYSTTVRVAVRRGRGDLEGAASDALQAIWLALGIGVAVSLVIGVGAPWLLELLGNDPLVVAEGTTYLRISLLGVPFHLVGIACVGYLYGLPDTRRPFLVLALAAAVNLGVELVLVFGLDWGIAGAAWGTVTAQVLGAGLFLWIVVPALRADGLHHLRVVPQVMWEVVKVGAYVVHRTGFLLLALAVATASASRVGTAELAAHQIAVQVFLFLSIGVDMFKVAGQALIGNALGAGRREEVRDVVAHLYGWAGRAGVALAAGTLLAAPVLPGLFSSEPDVRSGATLALVVLAVMQLPGAVTFVLDGVLMGANDFADLRWQTTLAFLAALPFYVAVMVRPSLGLGVVWAGMLVWVAVRALKNHTRVQGEAWMTSADAVA